jgi:hypothetical protein
LDVEKSTKVYINVKKVAGGKIYRDNFTFFDRHKKLPEEGFKKDFRISFRQSANCTLLGDKTEEPGSIWSLFFSLL